MNNKKIINIAQEVINTEIAALKKLQKSIGKSFCQAINLILNTKPLLQRQLQCSFILWGLGAAFFGVTR